MGGQGRVVRNILALLVNQAGTWSVTLVLTLVLPPYLGASGYGLYAFVVAYMGFFGLGMSLGTGMYLTWRIAREPELAGRLTFNTLVMQLPLALVCCAVGVLLMPLLDAQPLVITMTVFSALTIVAASLAGTCTAALGGLQLMRAPARISLLTSVFGAVLIVAAVILHFGLVFIMATGLVAQVVGLIWLLAYTQRKIVLDHRIDPRLWKTIVLGGMPFFAWSAVLLVYGQIDVTMLKALAGDTVVGWYAAAYRIVSIPIFIPTVVVTAMLPALSAENNSTTQQFRSLASRAIRLVAVAAIPASAGTLMLASGLLKLLHYPASFNPTTPLIAILALHIPIVALDMVLGTAIVAIGRQYMWTIVGVVAAIFNPLMNLWLIPYTQHTYGNGAIGASVVTVLTEALMFAGALILKPRTVFSASDVFYIARCLLAAAIMVPAVWALSARTGVLPAVAYGMVLYAMAAYTLQVVRNEDLSGLLRVVAGRFGSDFARLNAGWVWKLIVRDASADAVSPDIAEPARLDVHVALEAADSMPSSHSSEREVVLAGMSSVGGGTSRHHAGDAESAFGRIKRDASFDHADGRYSVQQAVTIAPTLDALLTLPASAATATSTHFSVIMCTCDRPDTIERAVRSIANQHYASFDLLVVDQSHSDETRHIVERLMEDHANLRYLHLDEVGLSRAYNAGVRHTQGTLLAFTDDDCVAPPEWLATIERSFAAEADTDLIYGQVLMPDELLVRENVEGVTPALPIPARRRMNRREGFHVFGMGANFAARRTIFDAIGGFDEILGGGGPLKSAQDFDYTYRVFRHGSTILLDPEVVVYHYGFRTLRDWPAVERSYAIGVGGFYFKHVRAGDPYAAWLLTKVLAWSVAREVKRALVSRGQHAAWERVGNVFVGMRESLRFSVDRDRRLYYARQRG